MDTSVEQRKALFREFIGRAPNTAPAGKKKEAVEKVFFFSDEQFNEICEDLSEEIMRRKKEGADPALKTVAGYSQKRNIVREQLSLLETPDLQSLVEDTLLVLMHKHSASPEEKVECLTKLVEDLQQIVTNNTPQASPAMLMRSVERTRYAIEQEKDALSKAEVLLGALSDSTEDLSPETQELFSIVRRSISEEKKRQAAQTHITPELQNALILLCNTHNREGYAKKMQAHGSIPEEGMKARAQTQTAVEEFLLLLQMGALRPPAPQAPAPPQAPPTPLKSPLEESVTRVMEEIGELEHSVQSGAVLSQIKEGVVSLYREKPALVASLKAAKGSTQALDALPSLPSILTEKDAFSALQSFYSALVGSLP